MFPFYFNISSFSVLNSSSWTLRDWDEESGENTYYKPTIINLSENGMTIKNNGGDTQPVESTKKCGDNIYEPVSTNLFRIYCLHCS